MKVFNLILWLKGLFSKKGISHTIMKPQGFNALKPSTPSNCIYCENQWEEFDQHSYERCSKCFDLTNLHPSKVTLKNNKITINFE